jgi:hypothetical protein
VASAGGFALTAVGAQAVSPSYTAITKIANRSDGGNHDCSSNCPTANATLATDNFTRTATITRGSEVPVSNCPGGRTGYCYQWSFTIRDKGTFTTNPTSSSGAESPNFGKPLDSAISGKMTGGTTTGKFYSSWKSASESRVPASVDDQGMQPTGRQTTTNWVEQFFGGGAVFNSTADPGHPDLGNWGWTYTARFGADPACPNDSYRWVDSSANGSGSSITDGDILAPDASDCTSPGPRKGPAGHQPDRPLPVMLRPVARVAAAWCVNGIGHQIPGRWVLRPDAPRAGGLGRVQVSGLVHARSQPPGGQCCRGSATRRESKPCRSSSMTSPRATRT